MRILLIFGGRDLAGPETSTPEQDTLNKTQTTLDQQDRMYSSAEAVVDLERICANLRVMRSAAGEAAVMAVVKADAYGHGAVAVAEALEGAGVEFLAVAQLSEAIELRRAGSTARIVVFGIPLTRELTVFAEYGIDLVAASDRIVRHLAQWRSPQPLNVHLKVDTGMHRLGIAPADIGEALRSLSSAPGVHLAGLWTHLASADEPASTFTAEQVHLFEPLVRTYESDFDYVHVAATSGVWNFRNETIISSKPMVRLGISLYGYLEDEETSRKAGLLPAMRFVSRVAQVRRIRAGESVSYNRTWTAREDTSVATVAAGYADGYSRVLSNRAFVGIGGQRFPVAGTVCMDMFMVDLHGSTHTVVEDDEVVLFGEGGPSVFEVAEWSDTIVYEVCTSVSGRVRRTYQ